MRISSRRLGEFLVARRVLSRDALDELLAREEAEGVDLANLLVADELVGEQDLTAAVANELGVRLRRPGRAVDPPRRLGPGTRGPGPRVPRGRDRAARRRCGRRHGRPGRRAGAGRPRGRPRQRDHPGRRGARRSGPSHRADVRPRSQGDGATRATGERTPRDPRAKRVQLEDLLDHVRAPRCLRPPSHRRLAARGAAAGRAPADGRHVSR